LARQFAIADIHGCAKTFERLIFDELAIQRADELFLLGDYINKGPDSKGVLDIILYLRQSGYDVRCLRGNHDQYLIEAFEDPEKQMRFLQCGGIETLRSFSVDEVRHIPTQYLALVTGFEWYFETPRYILVHAGLNFDNAHIFADRDAMLHTRDMNVDKVKTIGRQIVHGHVPTPLSEIEKSLVSSHISIDGGCVCKGAEGMQQLVALELKKRILHSQKNID
jgi:serine/threonine protein phosphatase 1